MLLPLLYQRSFSCLARFGFVVVWSHARKGTPLQQPRHAFEPEYPELIEEAPFNPTQLVALLPDLIKHPFFLGQSICDAVKELSANTFHVTFHLPLTVLVKPEAIPLQSNGFVYGSLHSSGNLPAAVAAHLARTCSSILVTVEQHVLSSFIALEPHPMVLPLTARERTVLTLARAGKECK